MAGITIAGVREKYPQYKDMSDKQLVDALHKKYYADMPADTFYNKVGFKPQEEHPVLKAMSPWVRNTTEGAGLIAGSVGGGVLGGPVGAVAGSGLGYAAGRQLANIYDEYAGLRKRPGLWKQIKSSAGDVAEGAALEAGGQVAGKVLEAGARAAGKSATKLYEEVLKPVPSMGNEKRAMIVNEGLSGRYPITNKGLEKLGSDIKGLNEQIANNIQKYSKTGDKIYMDSVVKRVEGLKNMYSSLPPQRASEFNKEIDDVVGKYMSKPDMTPSEAQAMKQTIYRIHSKHYGEMKTAVVETEKQIARGIKEELNTLYPELQALNENDSRKIQLQKALERAVNRTRNRETIGLHELGAGAAGSFLGGAPGATASAFVSKALRDPAIASRLAFALDAASKAELAPLAKGSLKSAFSFGAKKATDALTDNIFTGSNKKNGD